jgi:hypothetical protein
VSRSRCEDVLLKVPVSNALLNVPVVVSNEMPVAVSYDGGGASHW